MEKLKTLLFRRSKVSEEAYVSPVPAFVSDWPEISVEDFPQLPPSLKILPLAFMKRFCFVPLNDSGDAVLVAMADPLDFNTREAISGAYGRPLKVVKAPEEAISQFIYRWYEAEADMSQEKGEGAEEGALSAEDQLWDDPEHLKDMASEAPVIRLVNHLIANALESGASDIHIEPRRQHVQVRYRIDGILHDRETLAKNLKAAITSRIKLMAKMDIAEMRLPQDGKIRFRTGRQEVDIRVSCLPTHLGEALVLRLLHKEDVQLDLESLGFPPLILDRFREAISLPYGMLLVTGPTGSGKTTTLYAALNTINTPEKKIVTVEDPVEYQIEGINQIQVQPNIGLTFAKCLRSFLRHDPDVMLVGEIRDMETADIAVQAALTGHMVFSTLHTNDAAGAIVRLEEMGVERFMVVSSLVGVLAQRLVRRVCRNCRQEVQISEEERSLVAREMGVSEDVMPQRVFKGMGCADCGDTGYRGRSGIFEFLPISEGIQQAIVEGAGRPEIVNRVVADGMITLRMDGINKIEQGITTFEEVLRVTR
ncbi:Type II secretion system protein E [uncultured Desulfobacterium sp.]|uniref:Type II secretion system protein E n=1 Tax=uncultured Desulfobacterium sp. TaxID=201089 RepID=A0A445MVF5_9BACT|nr:Type II secretion system protein E [uncultured Desulfobacterium sp.]